MAINPLIAGAAIGAGASLFGSASSARASKAMSKEQMEFQERMSNTAYQRAASDMEAAGLNRILAIGSPATTPGGAMGIVPDYGSSMAQGANAGMQYGTSAASIRQTDATIQKTLQETKVLNARQKTELAKSEVFQAIAPIIANAGKDFGALMSILRDQNMWTDIMTKLQTESKSVISSLNSLLLDIYGSRYQDSTINRFLEGESDIKIGN